MPVLSDRVLPLSKELERSWRGLAEALLVPNPSLVGIIQNSRLRATPLFHRDIAHEWIAGYLRNPLKWVENR